MWFCRLYLLRDASENLISCKTEGRTRCQNFLMRREVNTAGRKHTLASYSIYYIYLIDLLLNKDRKNTISANLIKKIQINCRKTWLTLSQTSPGFYVSSVQVF